MVAIQISSKVMGPFSHPLNHHMKGFFCSGKLDANRMISQNKTLLQQPSTLLSKKNSNRTYYSTNPKRLHYFFPGKSLPKKITIQILASTLIPTQSKRPKQRSNQLQRQFPPIKNGRQFPGPSRSPDQQGYCQSHVPQGWPRPCLLEVVKEVPGRSQDGV